jgi:hypothetical protein
MDDQDLINLQKLVGRTPQPSLLDPPTPEHELLAQALLDYGGPLASRPAPTPDQLAMADALEAHGKQGAQPSGIGDYSTRPSEATSLQPVSYSYPAQQGGALSPSRPAPDAGTQIAMGSPANLDLPWQTMADQYTSPPPKPAPPTAPPPPAPPANLQTTIDPIPGYDETGDNAWRASNDQIFLDAVNRYNAANGYRPGDPGYWTADMLKAQAMQESGGSRHAFMTDPLTVNSHLRDWDPHKKTVAGLERGQSMTPVASADGALKWLKYKGWSNGNYLGDVTALQNYNGRTDRVANLPNVPFSEWYAARISQLARDAEARRSRN